MEFYLGGEHSHDYHFEIRFLQFSWLNKSSNFHQSRISALGVVLAINRLLFFSF